MVQAPGIARFVLAGPGAALASVAVMLGMPLWLPAGQGGVDNIVVPLILMPLIWAALFFHACLDRALWRVAAAIGLLSVLNGGLIAWRFSVENAS